MVGRPHFPIHLTLPNLFKKMYSFFGRGLAHPHALMAVRGTLLGGPLSCAYVWIFAACLAVPSLCKQPELALQAAAALQNVGMGAGVGRRGRRAGCCIVGGSSRAPPLPAQDGRLLSWLHC